MSLVPDTHPPRPRRPLPAWISTCLACLVLGVPAVAAEGERFDLETSDGVSLAVWHYAPPEDVKPLATVIVVHDLEGSHKMVEPLAVALQSGSCAVWVPDLRGHGASTKQAGRDTELDVRQMRKADYEQMAAGAGGTLRTQAAVRGDLETVYAFLASRDTAAAPVAVIGCGAGATIAALWTAADWTWPPLASGPQGQTVRALVLVSPVWAAKGLTLQPALASDTVKREVPLMIVSGKGDRDAVRLFEQLKRLRPRGWFDQRAVGQFTKAKEVEKPGDASLFLMELDTTLAGEKLVRDDAARVSDRIKTFLGLVLDQPRER